MNIAIGRRTFKPFGWRNIVALTGAIAIVGTLAAVNELGGFESGSSPAEVAPAVPAPVVPEAREVRTHYYFVDSQEQADRLYQADLEQRSSFTGTSDDIHVIDVSTPEGQETARLLNAEMAALQELGEDVRVVLHDLTTGGGTTTAAPSSAAASSAPAPIPTYYYLVESEEQGAAIMMEDQMVQSLRFEQGLPQSHRVEVINVSTPEGQRLAESIQWDLVLLNEFPDAGPSLVRVISLAR